MRVEMAEKEIDVMLRCNKRQGTLLDRELEEKEEHGMMQQDDVGCWPQMETREYFQ